MTYVQKDEDYGTINLTILQGIAAGLGKTVDDLIPWVDYDPIDTDQRTMSTLNSSRTGYTGGVRYTGD